MAGFASLAPKEDDVSELFAALKLEVCLLISRWHWGFRYEGTWFNPMVKHNLVRNECKQSSAIVPQVKKKATASISPSDTDSSDDDEEPDVRRGLLYGI